MWPAYNNVKWLNNGAQKSAPAIRKCGNGVMITMSCVWLLYVYDAFALRCLLFLPIVGRNADREELVVVFEAQNRALARLLLSHVTVAFMRVTQLFFL